MLRRMENAATEKKISSRFIYFVGSFGGILFGYDIGVMTGALPFLQIDWGLQNEAGSLDGSLLRLCLVLFLVVQSPVSCRISLVVER